MTYDLKTINTRIGLIAGAGKTPAHCLHYLDSYITWTSSRTCLDGYICPVNFVVAIALFVMNHILVYFGELQDTIPTPPFFRLPGLTRRPLFPYIPLVIDIQFIER